MFNTSNEDLGDRQYRRIFKSAIGPYWDYSDATAESRVCLRRLANLGSGREERLLGVVADTRSLPLHLGITYRNSSLAGPDSIANGSGSILNCSLLGIGDVCCISCCSHTYSADHPASRPVPTATPPVQDRGLQPQQKARRKSKPHKQQVRLCDFYFLPGKQTGFDFFFILQTRSQAGTSAQGQPSAIRGPFHP